MSTLFKYLIFECLALYTLCKQSLSIIIINKNNLGYLDLRNSYVFQTGLFVEKELNIFK